jgi:sec-independent protein translocase protein TatA
MFDSMGFINNPNGWIIILVIVLVLFGGSRIPEMMRGLGTGVKEFKKGIKEEEEPAEKKEAASKE